MDHKRLKEILIAFADDPDGVLFERNEILVQIQQETISAKLHQDGGVLYVEENGQLETASRWVATRIAQLDQLAHNIGQLVIAPQRFITSSARLLDQVSATGSDSPIHVADTLGTLRDILSRRPAGMCSVQYLTSDAGEGKTTLISQLAIDQATAFRQRRSTWLLVPIALGGNPFLRLENIIAAGLLNQLRIRRLFYEGFVELIRLGFIVLALDGFEEIFVETAGDAVSSLGNLIRDLKGEGTVLIAARTAYFDFRRLDQQASLYDSLPDYEVAFSKLSLDRWGETEFLALCNAYELDDGIGIYARLRRVLPEDHPLLTRAVFVRRIIELARDNNLDFLDRAANINDLFRPFIDSILDREIRYKWIDSSSGVSMALLSNEEHHELLGLLAEEMLLSKRTVLPISACQDYADIFCDVRHKPPMLARQVRERITSHALLSIDATKTQVAFDHDHFREFFLGEMIGAYLLSGSGPDLRKILRVGPIAPFALDTGVSVCVASEVDAASLIKVMHDVALTEGPASFVRENCSALITRALNRFESYEGAVIRELVFPPNSLDRRLSGVTFESCFFQSTALSAEMQRVDFDDCEFEWLEIGKVAHFTDVRISRCKIRAISLFDEDGSSREFFEPRAIKSILASYGLEVESPDEFIDDEEVAREDVEMKYVRKVLAMFLRSTVIADAILLIKFGRTFSEFESRVLPELLNSGLLVEVTNRGGGSQRRFRLGKPVSQISGLLSAAQGSFSSFLKVAKES